MDVAAMHTGVKILVDKIDSLNYFHIFPAKHFVVPDHTKGKAIKEIQKELDLTLPTLDLIVCGKWVN